VGKIILDLCGGTGAWSRPYKEAGYDVRLVTLPEIDIRNYIPPSNVHGILAAPPCTEFAVSGARWWATKPPELLAEAVDIAVACMDVIELASPAWWALENPVGRLRKFIGPPVTIFSPCEYGEDWSKRTCLWGKFTMPPRNRHKCKHEFWGWRKLGGKSERTKRLRSETSAKFAQAFFEANP